LNFSSDVSGITIHPTWHTLFIVSDEASSLNEVTKTGEFLRSWYIPLDQAEGVAFGENEHIIYMVADRGGKLYHFDFNFDPFVPPANLFINEFMASNDVSFPGPQGDFPDWIEIYNAGQEAIMLGGYYLADDLSDPTAMFQIPDTYPDSVTVTAGGYILFYANKGQESSVLNLIFKLKGGGEHVGIWTPEQDVIDTITYGSQAADTSYGRFPDGGDNWEIIPTYTPGATNATNGIVLDCKAPVLLQNMPNPSRETTTIRFNIETAQKVTINVYSVTGSLVAVLANGVYTAGQHNVVWNASNLPSGYYLYSVETATNKVVKKATVIR
jgi:hypothetical protein